MLHILPTRLLLSVLSYLPNLTLCSLPTLSRQWLDFYSENQSTIFRNAAILHGYIQPKSLRLEDALSATRVALGTEQPIGKICVSPRPAML